MTSKRINDELTRLQEKVTVLAASYQNLRQELHEADKERFELRQQLNESKVKLKDFQKQMKFNTIASTLASDDALRNQLDSYIKEIDACIAFLSKD